MKITFLTVFPDLVKHVSEAAKTIDPSHDLLELHFFNSTTCLLYTSDAADE